VTHSAWTIWTLKIEAENSCEVLITLYQLAWRHVTQDLCLHFFSSIEHIAFYLFLSCSMYNRISLKLYFEPSSRTSSLKNLDIKSKGADLVLCVNMLVYRANMKLKKYSKMPSKNCYRGYVISESNEVNMRKGMERKLFLFYSLYAWCCPLVLVIVSMVFDLMPIIPSSYLKPNFGDNKCWFSSKWHDFVLSNKSL